MSDEKRATVNIHNQFGRPILLHLHETVPDDGAGRPFLGRLVEKPIELKAGHNAGIDKEWWTEWCTQNKGSTLLNLLTAEDET